MNNSDGTITSQGEPRPSNGNSTFRAIKYSMTYTGFDGRNLTPGDPIETNFNNNACESLSTQSIDLTSIKIYPNPASTNVTVQTNQVIDKLELYNVLGKKIRVESATNSFDLSDLASGIYILKIYAGIETYSRKIVKQ